MRDATKQVRDELTKRGVIWGKPAPEYWELLGGMPTRDYVTTVGDVNICETTAGKLVVENLSPEQAIAAVLGPREQPPHDQLQAENAKLRQLLRHMYECMGNIDPDGNHECDSCEYDNEEGKCDYERQMRELGIEVDG